MVFREQRLAGPGLKTITQVGEKIIFWDSLQNGAKNCAHTHMYAVFCKVEGTRAKGLLCQTAKDLFESKSFVLERSSKQILGKRRTSNGTQKSKRSHLHYKFAKKNSKMFSVE